jgi:molybdate transport system substrate-binding protein
MIKKNALLYVLIAFMIATTTGVCATHDDKLTIFAKPSLVGAEHQGNLIVFADASLLGAFSEIGQLFADQFNISVFQQFDSTPSLSHQIENATYADLFISDDKSTMDALKKEGYINNYDKFLATDLSLIVQKSNPANIHDLSDLAKPGIKIVIGSQDTPIGNRTIQMLNKLAEDPVYGPEFKQKVLSNVTEEPNVYDIVSKVALGQADAAFTYKADITKDLANKITKIEIPDKYNIASEYYIGMLNLSKYPDQTAKFNFTVENVEGRGVDILTDYGFEPIRVY